MKQTEKHTIGDRIVLNENRDRCRTMIELLLKW
jgi:hypothetical protein